MRAKNEFKFIAEAYDTKLLLERVVDGKLMCPEACCGSPVLECKCGEDCEHCNCFMIQKAIKSNGLTDKLLKEFYKMRDPDGDGSWPDDDDDRDHPDYGEPEYDDRGTGEIGREDEERVRLTLDSPGTASVHLPKGDPRIQKYLDKGYKIVKDYKKATQSEDAESDAGLWRDQMKHQPDVSPEEVERLKNRKPKPQSYSKKHPKREDNEEPKSSITGMKHKLDALAAAQLAGSKHKPYVSSFVGDGGRKIFAILGSDGKIAHKTRDKQKAYKWLKDNYENI